MGFNFSQLAQDIVNPAGAVMRQGFGWNAGERALINPVGSFNQSLSMVPGGSFGDGKQPPAAAPGYVGLTAGQLTPEQSAQARDADFDAGQKRWAALVGARPEYAQNLSRMRDMSYGLNAGEMQASREQMIRGMQGKEQNAIRNLYSQQARSGVRGGMAGAQQARLQRQAMGDRQAAEQKLMLDNYALRRQGLQDYSQAVNRDISGELGTGMGIAGLGVSDRTAATQAAINQAMMQANANRSRGVFGDIFSGLFGT